jgi:hypothetical protein
MMEFYMRTAVKKTTSKAAGKSTGKVLNISAIARKVKLSRQTVYRKLRAGKSVEQIKVEAEAWRRKAKEQEEWRLRHANATNARGAKGGKDANGSAADMLVESFASAQRRRESAQASLRELEFKVKSESVVDRAEAVEWLRHLVLPLINALHHLPSQLRDSLGALSGPDCERLLDDQLRGILAAVEKYMSECEQRAGQPLGDGGLKVGDFYIVWKILPASEYESSEGKEHQHAE